MEWIGIARLCEKVGTLPRAGGLFDQDPLTVRRLQIVYQAEIKVQNDEQKKQEAKNRLKGK